MLNDTRFPLHLVRNDQVQSYFPYLRAKLIVSISNLVFLNFKGWYVEMLRYSTVDLFSIICIAIINDDAVQVVTTPIAFAFMGESPNFCAAMEE